MMINILRTTAALFGAIILAVALAGKPALGQRGIPVDDCPCFTSVIDGWFSALGPFELQPGQLRVEMDT